MRTKQSNEPLGIVVRGGEIRDDRRLRVAWIDVEHIDALELRAEAPRVVVVLHLEHPAANVFAVLAEEPLDVVAIDGQAAIPAPALADGTGAAQRSEPHLAVALRGSAGAIEAAHRAARNP